MMTTGKVLTKVQLEEMRRLQLAAMATREGSAQWKLFYAATAAHARRLGLPSLKGAARYVVNYVSGELSAVGAR
jgi:hypothetical protein